MTKLLFIVFCGSREIFETHDLHLAFKVCDAFKVLDLDSIVCSSKVF